MKRREDFRGKRVVIAGGGDSALDWTLALADIAAHIYVIHRRPKFRGAPESVARMEALAKGGKVETGGALPAARLEGDGGKLTAVIVATLEGAGAPARRPMCCCRSSASR